jgi:para-aminobenzoate synthetase component 1
VTILVEELVPVPAVLDVFEGTAGRAYRLLLDSASDPQRLGRYSFVAADPVCVVRSRGAVTEIVDPRTGATDTCQGDALSVVKRLVGAPVAADDPALPPFQCGAAGYIGYDWGATLETLPTPRYDDLGIPDVVLAIYDSIVAWDHQASRAWRIQAPHLRAAGLAALADVMPGSPMAPGASRSAWLGGSGSAAPDGSAPVPGGRAPAYPVAAGVAPSGVALASSFTHAAYLAAVARVREYILAGDIFQANLSQRLEAPVVGTTWALYRRLRGLNPAPFAAYVDFPEVTVMSASPERFLQVTAGGDVETRPIKGTSPRGYGPEHDAALGQALTESEKDRAENLMIVDLLRNDLSRVCAPGSVQVPELFALEYFATVHHLVSTVTGRLAPDAGVDDLIRAAFPGGSITGAPKVRAMEIIAELEPSRRGVYCGSIGYLSCTGAADLSIVIRTYVVPAGSDRLYFSVGGGIVADSDPESEYRETLDKARALIAALGAT